MFVIMTKITTNNNYFILLVQSTQERAAKGSYQLFSLVGWLRLPNCQSINRMCVCVCNPLWISFSVVMLWCLTYNLWIDLSCSPHNCLLYILQLSSKYDEICTYLVALLRFPGYEPAKSKSGGGNSLMHQMCYFLQFL